MIDLGRALHRVVATLQERGIPHMVIGGVANLVWGEARTTRDLDLTVDVESIGVTAFLQISEQLGTPMDDEPRDLAERKRLVRVMTAEGVGVDLALAVLPFELDAIGRAHTVSVLGIDVPVVGPEDFIIMKSVSPRPQDEIDVLGVLRRQGRRLELQRLDRTLEGLARDLAEPEIADRWRAAREAAGLTPG